MKRKLILFFTLSLTISTLITSISANTNLISLKDSLNTKYSFASNDKQMAPTMPTDGVTLEKAQVVAIDFADCTLLVIPEGKSNMLNNQILLRVTPDTVIQNNVNKKIYKLSDLEPGIYVNVVHSPVMTKSLPPQTVAYMITVL